MLAWNPMYWADYVADTTDLSMLEHGAYVQLMAEYYNKREPLPANAERLHRVCKCMSDAEHTAVAFILGKYFHLEGDQYRHNRIDRELAKSIQISAVRRESANKRHHANAGANAHANAMHKHTQSQSQSQSQEVLKTFNPSPEILVPRKDKTGTRIPPGFKVTDEIRQFAKLNALPDPDLHIAEFIDYWTAIPGQRGVKLDWPATFRNWLRRATNFQAGAGNDNHKTAAQQRNERSAANIERAFAEVEAADHMPEALRKGAHGR